MSNRIAGSIASIVLSIALPTAASATCPTFHTLTNGTTADATQVMDNFNAILQCPNFTGNVGIGTASPARALHVYGAAGDLFKIETGSGNAVVEVQSNANAQTAINFLNSSGSAQGQITYQQGSGNDYMRFTTSATERIRINSSGNVGIGTTSPSYLLHVNGTAYATGAAGALSDIRHKKDVAVLKDGALDAVMKLRPVTFQWKEPKDDGMKGNQIGFIAQEVEKVLPSTILTQNDADKTKGLKYNELIPVLTKALQEQQEEIRVLRAMNDRQAAGIKKLDAANRELKQRNVQFVARLSRVEELFQTKRPQWTESGWQPVSN